MPTHHLAVLAAAAALAISAGAASAGSLYRDQVHADSFGNLVIYSPSGYKRIVVGAGELASQLRVYGDGLEAPDTYRYRYHRGHYRERFRRHGRSEEEGFAPSGFAYQAYHHCSREPVILYGRSYMYGLPRNVVPVPTGICD